MRKWLYLTVENLVINPKLKDSFCLAYGRQCNTTGSVPDFSFSILFRGQKRKHDEEDVGKEDMESKQEGRGSGDESSKDSNEEEEGSSSEADEMAAALEAELNDFM